MQELTGIKYNSSEQNMTKSRQMRDMSDIVKVLIALMDGKNPFVQEPGLRNIINGVNAEDKIEKVTTRGHQICPQDLPPTSVAAKYHSLRVFLQVFSFSPFFCIIFVITVIYMSGETVAMQKRKDEY